MLHEMQTRACRGASQGWNMTKKDSILEDSPTIPSKTTAESPRDHLYITRSIISLHLQHFPLSILSAESLGSHPFLFLAYSSSFLRTSCNKGEAGD